MKVRNLFPLSATLIIGVACAVLCVQLTDMIPTLHPRVASCSLANGAGDYSSVYDSESAKMLKDTGMWFWEPITEYLTALAGLLVPTLLGILPSAVTERRIAAPDFLPKGSVTAYTIMAAVLPFLDYSTLAQYAFVVLGVVAYCAGAVLRRAEEDSEPAASATAAVAT